MLSNNRHNWFPVLYCIGSTFSSSIQIILFSLLLNFSEKKTTPNVDENLENSIMAARFELTTSLTQL
jgi:hypothetical protein